MKTRIILFAAASAVTLLATGATAQTKTATSAAAAPADVAELVVTGSRPEPRSRLESLAPVDVVTAQPAEARHDGARRGPGRHRAFDRLPAALQHRWHRLRAPGDPA